MHSGLGQQFHLNRPPPPPRPKSLIKLQGGQTGLHLLIVWQLLRHISVGDGLILLLHSIRASVKPANLEGIPPLWRPLLVRFDTAFRAQTFDGGVDRRYHPDIQQILLLEISLQISLLNMIMINNETIC